MSNLHHIGPACSSANLVSGSTLPATRPTGARMEALTDLPPALITGGSIMSLLSGLFWMLATGRLVTRREHEERVGDLKEQAETLRETVKVKDAQLEKLAIIGETTVKILASVEAFAREKRTR